MSSTSRRNPKSDRQSLFFHDLASPVSVHRAGGRFTATSQSSAVSNLWHGNYGGSDPPPPPLFTLDDRLDFSPEPTLGEFPSSPERGSLSSPSRRKSRAETSSAVLVNSGLSASWLSPAKSGEHEMEEKGRGSPVDGVVQPGAVLMLPPPREAVRPEMERSKSPLGALDEEEWVTVYGFSPGDTNLVLREFEKCGTILKHVPGPKDANWMHILYQNRYDAQRALGKNGAQINSVLIIGVKPIDYPQRQYLDERLNGSSHASSLIPSFTPRITYGWSKSASIASGGVGVSARPNAHLNGGGAFATDAKRQRSTGAIASPAKSVVSKVMDLMFGI